MSQIIWADDDASHLLRPLQRLMEGKGHSVKQATSYEQATRLIEDMAAGPLPFSLLADIILPLAPGKGTLSSYRGIELARFAIEQGAQSVVFLTVVPRREVEVDIKVLRQSMPRIWLFQKLELLEPGQIDALLQNLNGGKPE
jgi:CheY-like chemotaxis protein